MYIIDNTGNS